MMIKLHKNFSLKDYNTFGVEIKASKFFAFRNIEELDTYINKEFDPKSPYFVLGGGSNILFTKDYNGQIIHSNIKTIQILKEDEREVILDVGSGVIWDDFVDLCVDKGYYGLENLSLIPGNVGAAPVQNIGAYGVEVKDFIEGVTAYDIIEKKTVVFNNEECQFAYRNSIFKQPDFKKIVITSVQFRLSKQSYLKNKLQKYQGNWITKRIKHISIVLKDLFTAITTLRIDLKKKTVSIEYRLLKDIFQNLGFISLKRIRKTIIDKRNSKIPNPKIVGNAGSFFKNPIITKEVANKIKKTYPNAVIYPYNNDESKVSAGWLIKQCGWQGKTIANVGVYKDQTLIIANLGGAHGKDIYSFSIKVVESVFEKFGILLEREVVVLE